MPSPAIELRGISKSYDGSLILPPLDLTICRGDFLAVTGPNGGGKTTLLHILLKLTRPSTGTVTYLDADGHAVKHLNIGYLPQRNTIDRMFPITVGEVVASGKGRQTTPEQTRKVLDTFGLTDLTAQPIGALSGGQLQRVMIARALVSNPDVIVLDEPLSYLDTQYTGRLIEALSHLPHDTIVIVVSHDMRDFSKMARRHLIVDRDVCEICQRQHPHHFD